MIELTPLARPYAKALFASANESNRLEEMANELKTMAAVSKSEGVINTIENPVLSRQEVVDILVNLFEENISKINRKNIVIVLIILGILSSSIIFYEFKKIDYEVFHFEKELESIMNAAKESL